MGGKILWALLALIAFSSVRGALIRNGTLPADAPNTTVPATAPAIATITMLQYSQLYDGISYDGAVKTLGAPGVELSSNNIGGTHTVMYQWKVGFMASMNATFQNDKLVGKAQMGLK